jgi:hypothetical protein
MRLGRDKFLYANTFLRKWDVCVASVIGDKDRLLPQALDQVPSHLHYFSVSFRALEEIIELIISFSKFGSPMCSQTWKTI